MSSLVKKLMKQAKAGKSMGPAPGGFELEAPELIDHGSFDSFYSSLKMQEESIVPLDADKVKLHKIDVRGTVEGTGYRLSQAAFGDLCNFAKMPASFLKRLCCHDEQLALDVVSSCLASTFYRGPKKVLVIDSRNNRIEGIVGHDTYKPMSNAEVVDYAMSASPENEFAQGWTCGPQMRLAAVNDLAPVQPQKGDIVRVGMSVQSAINGDHSVRIASYNERLSCTNGMTRRDEEGYRMIPHLGDVKINVGQAVVQCAAASQQFIPMMSFAAQRHLGPEDIEQVIAFVSNTRHGGNETIRRRVIALAQNEAMTEGRENFDLTLWNFVNGCTACAHEAKSIHRKVEIENLGFKLLAAFQPAEAN